MVMGRNDLVPLLALFGVLPMVPLVILPNVPLVRRDVPVDVPLDLSTLEWQELPKYNGIQVSQLI